MKSLNILPPDKSHTFYSPIDTNLIRTGVIADGSCFFHALLYAINNTYRNMNYKQRTSFVQQIRQQLADNFTINIWKQIGNGEMFKLTILITLQKYIQNDHIMSTLTNNWNNTSLKQCFKILSTFTNLDAKDIIKKALQEALTNIKHHIKHNWVDEFSMEYISNSFKYNFFFINADTRKIYQRYQQNNYTHSIIFCWINQSHYELVGQINKHPVVTRIFNDQHNIIRHLKSHTNA